MSNWSAWQRRENQQSIHKAISKWVLQHPAEDIETWCQAQKVPAHRVLWPSHLYDDPQLLHRGFFQKLDHEEMGRVFYDGHVTQFSATPPKLDSAGPLLGQHSNEIRAMFDHPPEKETQ
jgi:crotonobetainyl-CoA:carnitine CoA-transferase CaiB-like acyl-CoA transferase